MKTAATPAALTFEAFRAANVARCLKWHPAGVESWSPAEWLTALVGEVGELASLLKMRARERDGLAGNKFSPTEQMIAEELADVQTYLDLLAFTLGVDLGQATVAKFNAVSERVGFPDRIAFTATQQQAQSELRVCHWQQTDEHCDTFDTGCGRVYDIIDAEPGGMKYCVFCGNPAEFSLWKADDAVTPLDDDEAGGT